LSRRKQKAEAENTPDLVTTAPHNLPVRRLDDVKAARELDLVWR
jgi:glycine dehydrogenase subunit 2